jgi:hypothetical protein
MHAAMPDPGTTRDRTPFALPVIDRQRDVWPDHLAAGNSSFPADVERRPAFCRAGGTA